METYITWGAVAVLALFLLFGMIGGLVKGLKRSSLHLIFFLASVLLAFFITKPITQQILGITITIDGGEFTISEYIVQMVQNSFNISNFETASEFLASLPNAILSPIMFIVLSSVSYFVFEIIYLIVARVCFGKKKEDFKNHKPYRAYGGVVGLFEGFLCLFVMFAPLTSLTKTYAEIVEVQSSQTVATAENSNKLQTIGETLNSMIPSQVTDAIVCYNNSVVGKIAGAGGLDNALFDYLSNFEINGEKIEFRKELVNVVDVYDDFVVVYNKVTDKDYKNLDLSDLRDNIEIFLNNGIFKTVISDTVKDIVVNFDDIAGNLNLPQTATEVIQEIKQKFSANDFDAYEYLKHDILKIFDTFEGILNNNLISKFENLTDTSLTSILEFVDDNSTAVSTTLKNVLSLNIIKDGFRVFINIASDKVAEFIQNDKGLEIALNPDITDKQKMVDDLIAVVDSFNQLNKLANISDILNSEDIIKTLTENPNLESTISQMGKTFDKIRQLQILVLPQNETRAEEVYVFDNILENYNLKLLGDEVYWNISDAQTTKIDTYTKFFDFIKTPIVKAKDLGLVEIITQGGDFDTVLDKILEQTKLDEDFLSKILLPFYQLNAMDLKTTFNDVIDQLSQNVSLLNFDEVKQENSLQTWHNELQLVGKTLNVLNQGEVAVEGGTKTYLKYLLTDSSDVMKVMEQILNDQKIAEVLEPVFSAKVFKNLTKDIFDNIDSSIGELTKVIPVTFADISNLVVLQSQEVRSATISTIENLLNLTLNADMNNISISKIGEILDVLKTNASNGGVFDNVFANLIWYMTGDSINGIDYTGKTPYEKEVGDKTYEDIKNYLNVSNADEYYTINYTTKFAELEDVVKFANDLNEKLDTISFDSASGASDFVNAVDDVLSTMTEEEKLEVIANTRTLLDNSNNEILSVDDRNAYGSAIAEAINSKYSESPEIATALLNLFKVSAS